MRLSSLGEVGRGGRRESIAGVGRNAEKALTGVSMGTDVAVGRAV